MTMVVVNVLCFGFTVWNKSDQNTNQKQTEFISSIHPPIWLIQDLLITSLFQIIISNQTMLHNLQYLPLLMGLNRNQTHIGAFECCYLIEHWQFGLNQSHANIQTLCPSFLVQKYLNEAYKVNFTPLYSVQHLTSIRPVMGLLFVNPEMIQKLIQKLVKQ